MGSFPPSSVAALRQGPPMGSRGYQGAEREAAFLVYCGAGGRELSRTARLVRVHRDTLRRWRDEDRWDQRLEEVEGDGTSNVGAVPSAVLVAQQLFPTLLLAAADRWLTILTSDEPRFVNAQAKLIELAFGLNGMVQPKGGGVTLRQDLGEGASLSVRVSDLRQLTPEQLATFRESGSLPIEAESPSEDV